MHDCTFLDCLGAHETANDRPDITARVFHQKSQALIKDIQAGVLGRVSAFVYTIEYQKRGLPHMHALIILEKDDKLLTTDDFDSVVRYVCLCFLLIMF